MKEQEASVNYEIFKFDLDTARLRLALLKENFKYRAFYEKFIESIDDPNFSFPAYHFENFGLPGVRFMFVGPNHNDTLKLLNPLDSTNIDKKKEEHLLQRIFYSHAVVQLEVNPDEAFEGMSTRTLHSIKKIKPYERFYSIDLRKKKKQIIREFEEFLNNAYRYRDYLSIETWEPDKSRFREEAWTHLEVWRLRRKRLPFSGVASKLSLTEDTAKKSFYRAFELTQGCKYDREKYKNLLRSVKKEDLRKTCESCSDREDCERTGVLCPEVLEYVNALHVRRSEKLLSNPENIDKIPFDTAF